MKRDDAYYRAMLARDPRFDGKFFVGVKTTGIYCRPICPARPKRENVEFFHSHHEAERAGYRPCMRCRPESAPQSPAWIGTSAIVQRAVKALNAQETTLLDEDAFAAKFGVTARHLRRLFVDEIGKTPKQLTFENRLSLARKLIVETSLPLTEVAFASGFASIRRFNAAFKERFKKAPRDVRRQRPDDEEARSVVRILLAYRPPFDFAGLMKSYERHRVGDLERFEDGKMHRIVAMNGKIGQVALSNDEGRSAVVVEIDFPDTSVIHAIVTRVRGLLDLNADPIVVANSLEKDPGIRKLLRRHPGIRIPSGWDPFEVAIGTILGQLVSVERGRGLVHDLIDIAGKEAGSVKLFPTPEEILAADLTPLKTTGARKLALVEFCRALVEKRLSLEPTQDVADFMRRVQEIKGLGPWTAQYMALKVLRDIDAFPAGDLVLARALEIHSREAIERMRPWRGYVAALLLRTYGERPKKESP